MDDACDVCSVKGVRGLSQQRKNRVDGHRTPIVHDLRERLTRNELHDEVRNAPAVVVVLPVVENAGNPAVGESGGMPRLCSEPLEEDGRVDEVVAKDLDRDLPTKHRVGGCPHLAHASDRKAACERIALTQQR